MGATDELTAERPLGDSASEHNVITFAPRKVAFIGVGGFGTAVVTTIKAKELAEAGSVRPGLAFFAFDVIADPTVVVAQSRTGKSFSVKLEPGRQYLQLGRDLDPRHLSYILRDGTAGNDDLRRLLDRQPGRRFHKNLEKGAEGERGYGLLGFRWSEPAIEEMVADGLGRLNNVRLRDGNGRLITQAPVDVFIIGSIAGGVGSAIALPLCGLVKRTMAKLGMPQNSFFTYIAVGPEAFPEKTLRRSNACETLGDLAVAQQEGIIP